MQVKKLEIQKSQLGKTNGRCDPTKTQNEKIKKRREFYYFKFIHSGLIGLHQHRGLGAQDRGLVVPFRLVDPLRIS